jgi:RNA polymerase sigma factor (sigma-70 family)
VLGEAFPDVLAAAQAGAPWAFERLYADLAPVVTGYLRLHGAFEPDDLASETFLGVFTGLASFSGGEQGFRSWVFTIAHRRLLDERRRLARRGAVVQVDAELPDRPGGDVEDEALGAVGEQRVHAPRCFRPNEPCCCCGSSPTSPSNRSLTCSGNPFPR